MWLLSVTVKNVFERSQRASGNQHFLKCSVWLLLSFRFTGQGGYAYLKEWLWWAGLISSKWIVYTPNALERKKWTTWLAWFFQLGNTACQLVEPRRTEVFVCPRGGNEGLVGLASLLVMLQLDAASAHTHRFKYVGWRRVLTLFNSVSPCSHSSGSWRSCKLCCVCICTSHLGDSPRGSKCPCKVNNELEHYLEKHYGL